MKMMNRVIFWICLLVIFVANANAALVDNGDGTITDTDRNLMWLMDANYAKTSGYDADGKMTWLQAMTWADNLVFASYDNWRLPSALNSDGTGPCYDWNCMDSEMGHMYRIELGNSAWQTNAGPFVNMLGNAFWSETPYTLNANEAWMYTANMFGWQSNWTKSDEFQAWAVRDITPESHTIYIDFDTPATGSNMALEFGYGSHMPLYTPYGTITLMDDIDNVDCGYNWDVYCNFTFRSIQPGVPTGDSDMVDAGSVGNHLVSETYGDSTQRSLNEGSGFVFNFDVDSVSFLYGSGAGPFYADVRDESGNIIDSFYQADAGAGQPAGPITLSGSNIRSFHFYDPSSSSNLAMIDNILITTSASPIYFDIDNDGVLDINDNCPNTPNSQQEDLDQDGTGDVCDSDMDGDGYSSTGQGAIDCDDTNAAINPGTDDNNCNGIDENCSGAADEGYVQTSTTCGIGACESTGQIICQNGLIQDTCAPGTPQDEICDNVDNDCNGNLDDNLTRPTSCGIGACSATGNETCTAGVWNDTCIPGTPQMEGYYGDPTCSDTSDNDCDGSTDLADTECKIVDLVETYVSNPPSSIKRGNSFSVTDTVLNQGGTSSGKSTTRYYLSLDTIRNTGDKLLTNSRSVPVLTPYATSTGTISVKVPSNTTTGIYYLLSCADDAKKVAESSETNNCIASGTTVQVTQ